MEGQGSFAAPYAVRAVLVVGHWQLVAVVVALPCRVVPCRDPYAWAGLGWAGPGSIKTG
jgi:hypothetical protein